jgi:hypothetical protein
MGLVASERIKKPDISIRAPLRMSPWFIGNVSHSVEWTETNKYQLAQDTPLEQFSNRHTSSYEVHTQI